MRDLRKPLLLLLSVLPFAPPLQAQEAVTLRYKFDKDEKLIYRLVNTMKQTQTVNGMDIASEMEQTDVSVRNLDRTDDKGNLHLKTHNKQLKIKANIGMLGEYKFDSQSDELDRGSRISSSLNAIYELLSGTTYSFTITPQGKVVEVSGYRDLMKDVLKENPLGAQFLGGGTDEAVRLSIGEQLAVLPENPVKPGDTWEVPYEVILPKIGTLQGKKKYTYTGSEKVGERVTAKISMTCELTANLAIKMEGVNVSGTLAIEKSSGTIQFDPEKGQLVSMKTSFTIGGDLSVETNRMTIEVKTSQTQNNTVEILDELPD